MKSPRVVSCDGARMSRTALSKVRLKAKQKVKSVPCALHEDQAQQFNTLECMELLPSSIF